MSVVEVLCHEMRPADILKIKSESNNANTGGGARDLRFRLEFAPCLDRFFPVEIVHERNTPYKIAEFEHLGADKTRTVETVRYAFKPTNSRPTEVRIAQINKLNFFLDLPDIAEGDGMLFMAFIRKSSGLSQAQYLTEKQISHPRSNKIIAAAMYEAIEEKHGNDAVVFSVDLV